MIKCKDCKHWNPREKCVNIARIIGRCLLTEIITFDIMSCTEAERADGLTGCCATCRQLFLECDFLNEALPDVCLNKMLCPEWAPREEKE